ncbi:MAG: hypothetical protein KO253_04045, partial [Methanobrevibacter arboriphilus]|nr:hypothetical protein [Methanobrevibacter arboriphilus]
VTVDGKLYENVIVDFTGGNWTVIHLTNHTGTYNVTVEYIESGTGNYTGFINSTSFNVAINSVNSTINVGNVDIGINTIITGQLTNYSGNGSDSLTVSVDGNSFNVTIGSSGGWSLNYTTNRTGNITVIVIYSGNENYTGFSNSTTFNVLKNSTNSTIIVDDVQVGTNATITGQLANFTVISSVNVSVDGKLYTDVFVDSTFGNWTVKHLTNHTGTYDVIVEYIEIATGNYTSFSNSTTFNVLKNSTNSTIIVDDVYFGENVSIIGQLLDYSDDSSDSLIVIVDGNIFNVTFDSAGGWNLTYLTNRTGNITVTVSYSGNDNYSSFINSTTFIVLKDSSNSSVIVVGDFKVGENITISGILVDGNNNPINNAQITITIGNETFNVTTNSTGDWSLVYTPLYAGEFFICVSWTGNDNYTGFINNTSFNVTKLATNSSIILPNNIKVSQTVLISGVLNDENDNTIAGANLEVIVGGESFNVTTDSVGVWSLNYTPKRAGIFDLSLVYLGNDRYDGFVENKIFNVSKLATTSSINIPSNVKVGKSITVSGVLTSGGKPLANTSVLVIVDGKTYKVTTNSDGVWKLSYTPKKAGKSTMKVSFAGNNDFVGFNVSKTFKVVGKVKIGIVKISKLVKVGKYRGFNLYSKVYTIKNVGSALGSKDYVKYFKNWYLEKLSKTSKIVKYQFITKSRILKVQVKSLGVGKQVKLKILVTRRKRL